MARRTKNVSPHKNVAVVLFTTGYTGWQKRQGIFRYIGEGHPWNVRLVSSAEELESLKTSPERLDGALLSVPDPTISLDDYFDPTLPLVLFNINLAPSSAILRRTKGTVFIHHDSRLLGETAAAHLLACGRLRSFACLGEPGSPSWSVLRCDTFTARIERAGFACTRLTADREIRRLSADLAALPRPLGLFTASDRTALLALAACQAARLRVPADVAVLGVDDDEAICESTDPPLSSVRTNPDELGYIAATLLDELMKAPNRRSRHTTLQCRPSVTTRGTTDGAQPHGRVVAKALAFIAANATRGIGPDDVAHHLGISRRLLDLRFRSLAGESVLSAIQRTRLENVKRLLRETDETIESITAQSGYHAVNHLKKVFLKAFGMSMREWRSTTSPK